MTKNRSSLPLLLGIVVVISAVAGFGWLSLDRESDKVAQIGPSSGVIRPAPVDWEVPLDAQSVQEGDDPLSVDMSLRKARLAASAGILVFPESESALYHYARILTDEPNHTIALTELETVLGDVAAEVAEELSNEAFDEAFRIASEVARYFPEHDVVAGTMDVLNARADDFFERALAHARAGEDEQADQAFASAAAVPGRNDDRVTAVEASIREIRDARIANEQLKREQALQAMDAKKTAWMTSVRDAIRDGSLLTPAARSAVDLLQEHGEWADEKAVLTGEVLDALIAAARTAVDEEDVATAEHYLSAAAEYDGSEAAISAVRQRIEDRIIGAESSRVAAMSELVMIVTAEPRYPRPAYRRKQSGWVELYFTVSTSGATTDIEVQRAEPASIFDAAAVKAVEQWRFEPVEYRGRLIEQRAGARVVFNYR